MIPATVGTIVLNIVKSKSFSETDRQKAVKIMDIINRRMGPVFLSYVPDLYTLLEEDNMAIAQTINNGSVYSCVKLNSHLIGPSGRLNLFS